MGDDNVPAPECRQDDAPVDFSDALAIVGFGDDLIDTGIDARLADALSPGDAQALVATLDRLRRALQAGDPHASRRGTGLIGRLLGRDVQAEAEATQLRARIGVLRVDADRSAQTLASRVVSQAVLDAALGEALAALAARIATARDWLARDPDAGLADTPGIDAPRAQFERRLQQLDTVHLAWDIACRQLALLRDQNLDLLARHQRIRDVLVPAWRQQALAGAAADGAAVARQAADTQAAIAAEVDAMAAKLDPADPGPTAHGEGP